MIKLVIFDMDGLMFDTEQINYRAFSEIVKEEGYEPTFEQFIAFLGLNAQSIQKLYRTYYGEDVDAQGLYKKVGQRSRKIAKEEGVPVKKGLRELLSVLKEKGIPCAVASGSDLDVIQAHLKQTGLTENFDQVVSSRGIKRGKPFPDIFLNICEHFQIKPEDTLVLEDSTNGVQAALSGNIPVINIPDLLSIPEEQQEKCVAVLKDLTEVIPYINEM